MNFLKVCFVLGALMVSYVAGSPAAKAEPEPQFGFPIPTEQFSGLPSIPGR